APSAKRLPVGGPLSPDGLTPALRWSWGVTNASGIRRSMCQVLSDSQTMHHSAAELSRLIEAGNRVCVGEAGHIQRTLAAKHAFPECNHVVPEKRSLALAAPELGALFAVTRLERIHHDVPVGQFRA